MATVQDVVLELTNNRNFYEAFTCVLRTAYKNKYNFNKMNGCSTGSPASFRKDMMDEVKRYYKINSSYIFPDAKINNSIIAELVSHYSDEVFGFYVPVDQALDFMTEGWELATHKQMTPFQKRGWTEDDRFNCSDFRSLNNISLKEDDGSRNPWFWNEDKSDYHACNLDKLTKIDEPDQLVKYARRLTKSYVGDLVIGKIYKFLPHNKCGWYSLDERGNNWSSNLEPNSNQWVVVPEHEYLKQEAGSHLDAAIESFEQVTQTQQTKQESNMNPQDVIKTKIMVFGDDAADLTDDQLFGKVQSVEAEIEHLDSVKNKPEKLKARIKEMQDQLTVLIEYIDSRP